MGINKEARKRAHAQLSKLTYLGYIDMVRAAAILGCDKTRTIKGGITARLSLEKLRKQIRSTLGRGTFEDRLERFADYLENCTLAAEPVQDAEDPEQQVMRLISQVQSAAIALSDEALFQLVDTWIGRFRGDCWEDLDYRIEPLGFRYEEDENEDLELAPPSPAQLKQVFQQQSASDFYHSFIWLAGNARLEGFSPPPSPMKAGYNFLEQLAEHLESLGREPS